MFFIKNANGEWQKLNRKNRKVFHYDGGYYYISAKELGASEVVECAGWNELYQKKRYCPLQADVTWDDVWISPDGSFYNGDAHENRAAEIMDIMYNEHTPFSGDRLEELGWIKATTSLMWEARADCWENKKLTQRQYDALFDWCMLHHKSFPKCENVD